MPAWAAAQVDRWWGILLPRIRDHLHINGGPIVLVQVIGVNGPLQLLIELLHTARWAQQERTCTHVRNEPVQRCQKSQACGQLQPLHAL